MVVPGISVEEDVAAIGRGEGFCLGDNIWSVNNRQYRHKGDGAMFPISGEGVISPSRLELLALRHLIESDGDLDDLYRRTRRNPDYDADVLV